MSYILDALRRAEADRQRGQVPSLGATQLSTATHDAAQPGRRKLAWMLVVATLAVAGAGWVGWWRGTTVPAKAPPRPQEMAKETSSAAPEAAPAAISRPLPQVVSAPPAPLPAPPVSTPANPMSTSAPPVAVPAAKVPASAAPAPSPEQPGALRPTKLADLNPEQRRELPALVVNGSVYSDSAASRFVILNGQVLREGDTAAPGLVVEKLLPKSAHLRWRGQLLELPL